MKVNRVFLEQIEYCNITKLEITEKVNEHSFAKISGIIPEDKADKCMHIARNNSYITLKGIMDDGTIKNIFVGLIYKINISSTAKVNKLDIILVSGTMLMDGNENTKTFQNVSMNYGCLFRNINSDNSAHCMMFCNDSAISKMVVQYKETNWSFAKRIASNLGTCIYPYVHDNVPGKEAKYYIGVNDNAKINNIHDAKVNIKQSIEKFMTINQSEDINSISDCISFEVKSREYFPIGSKVLIDQTRKPLFVYKLCTKIEKSEVINTYILKPKEGFNRIRKFNNRIIGASLSGSITSVSMDKVKISVEADSNNSDCGSKEFLYSTIYSSPDGTGWYCMPESGDKIRVYFPTEKEEDAYVISSVHLQINDSEGNNSNSIAQGGNAAPRSNPDNKSISNKYNKEILFTPTSLTITNNKGLSIVLDDNEGITIESDKGIYLNSTIVQLCSDQELYVMAKDLIKISQDDKNTILMENNNMFFDGGTLKLQEN